VAVTTRVERIRGAVVFTAGMEIDADGSARAYGPPGCPIEPLDHLANAKSKDGSRYVAVVCIAGQPVVQGDDDPCPGCFVASTALADHSKTAGDPTRYVDSESVPFIVVPSDLHAFGVRLGDVAMVTFGGKSIGAIVADIGPHGHFGEGSIALADAVGVPSSPKHGGVESGVTYVIFPGSATVPAWPRAVLDFQAAASARYAQWQQRDA
jgi:hypothetical protein